MCRTVCDWNGQSTGSSLDLLATNAVWWLFDAELSNFLQIYDAFSFQGVACPEIGYGWEGLLNLILSNCLSSVVFFGKFHHILFLKASNKNILNFDNKKIITNMNNK